MGGILNQNESGECLVRSFFVRELRSGEGEVVPSVKKVSEKWPFSCDIIYERPHNDNSEKELLYF